MQTVTPLPKAIAAAATRQVHLDFHTAGEIPGVGAAFDARAFQAALQRGLVDSVTLFAKCHHSWSYYSTSVGRPHPHLAIDLLDRQIEAAHAIGVRRPIYYAVGWSAQDAADHPEWCARAEDGQVLAMNVDPAAAPGDPRPIVSWLQLCPAAPGYRQLILDQTREICDRFDVDGLFYDICFNTPVCHCEACRRGMADEGVNDADAAAQYAVRKWLTFMRDCNRILKSSHPAATVFYNGSAALTLPPEVASLQTHLELEDLPTTWGGYDKFPPRARFFAAAGKPLVAMSGKFHTTWGEFGGYKAPQAVRFEAAMMRAFGAGCSFGDQFHPSGQIDPATYEMIGDAYAYIEHIEPYCKAAAPFSNLAILAGQAGAEGSSAADAAANDQGVANMLMEGQYSFDVIATPHVDLSRYQTIILTGSRTLDQSDAARLRDFVAGGGSLVVLDKSVFLKGSDELAIDIGAAYAGPARFAIDYTTAAKKLGEGLVASPFLNYVAADRFLRTDGQALGTIHEPYFDRTYERYCSHQNTPNRPSPADHLAAIRKGRVLFFAHALGKIYLENGARLHRELFLKGLKMLHDRPAVRTSMPSAGKISLMKQAAERRYVLHLLYAPPMQRGRCLVVEDLVTLHGMTAAFDLPERIDAIHFPLSPDAPSVMAGTGRFTIDVPPFAGHQMIVLEY